MTASPVTGRIFEIQRFCIHDGPGIRTTLFLKGCPLRCTWCHNPEGQSRAREVSFAPDRCIACGACVAVCRHRAHVFADSRHAYNRDRCVVCAECVEKCHAGALECVGRDITVDEALVEALKDRPFYETSGGGLTLSGGEPLSQIEFSAELLRRAKEAGLHTAVETCGYGDAAALERVRPFVDLFLYDVKETDPERHVAVTGVPNEPIFANLRRLHDAGASVLVRLPIVPGINDRPDHFVGVAALCKPLTRLLGVEVLPYHRLGLSKNARFGIGTATPLDAAPPEPAAVQGWIRALRERGLRVVNPVPDPD